MTAAIYNFTIEQGANLNLCMTLYGSNNALINLNNYSARMMAKKNYDSEALITLNTQNGGITLGGEGGTLTLIMSAAQTASLLAPNNLKYDIEIQDPAGFVTRILQGNIKISAEVTK